MKQYTSNNQTAKLIELGLPKPKSKAEYDLPAGDWRIGANGLRPAYSIGELIEMLPRIITYKDDDEDVVASLEIGIGIIHWNVSYVELFGIYINTSREELIDALFDMIVKLKEEGVI